MRRRNRRPPPTAEAAPSEQESQIQSGLESLRVETARDVMTPRVDVVAIPAPVRFADVARAVRRSGHSHFPVFEGDLDHLLGVLFVKDIFHLDDALGPGGNGGRRKDGSGAGRVAARNNLRLTGNGDDADGRVLRGGPGEDDSVWLGIPSDLDVTDRLRHPFVVPESRIALELLAEMRKLRRAFAVVVDEYGGVAGVLTINDLVSELIGDLRDEFDRGSTPAIQRVDRNRFLIDGSCDVDEVRAALGVDIPDGDYVTFGGFLFDGFGRVPEEGESLEWHGWAFRVDKMDRRRIAKVLATAPSATMAIDDGAGDGASAGK